MTKALEPNQRRQASIRSIIGRRQASITSIIGDTFLHWRVVSGPTRWSPKKTPPGPPLNPCIARGLAAKTGPVPPPYPLSLLAEQVLTFETKGSLGRAFVTKTAKSGKKKWPSDETLIAGVGNRSDGVGKHPARSNHHRLFPKPENPCPALSE